MPSKFGTRLLRAVRLGAEYHDLGKLDAYNQEVLRKANSREPLPVKHWDAGVAALFRAAPTQDPGAAIAVYAHHRRAAQLGGRTKTRSTGLSGGASPTRTYGEDLRVQRRGSSEVPRRTQGSACDRATSAGSRAEHGWSSTPAVP